MLYLDSILFSKNLYLVMSVILSTQMFKRSKAGSANFCKGPDSKDFRFCRPHNLCCNHLALPGCGKNGSTC